MNTHSHSADGRMEVLCAAAIRSGADLECAREILEAGTTDEALAVLDSYGILKETMAVVMEKIQFYLDHRSYDADPSGCCGVFQCIRTAGADPGCRGADP